MIITPDPFGALYEGVPHETRTFKKSDVDDVNYLVRISQGKRDTVETSQDWMIIGKLFEFWTRRWPMEWQEYAQTIKNIKATRRNKQGTSESGGIKYLAALPPKFERLIKAIFPLQEFDKEFVYKLINNVKIVQVGEKNDAWFTIPEAPQKRKDIVEEAVSQVKKELDDNTE